MVVKATWTILKDQTSRTYKKKVQCTHTNMQTLHTRSNQWLINSLMLMTTCHNSGMR